MFPFKNTSNIFFLPVFVFRRWNFENNDQSNTFRMIEKQQQKIEEKIIKMNFIDHLP